MIIQMIKFILHFTQQAAKLMLKSGLAAALLAGLIQFVFQQIGQATCLYGHSWHRPANTSHFCRSRLQRSQASKSREQIIVRVLNATDLILPNWQKVPKDSGRHERFIEHCCWIHMVADEGVGWWLPAWYFYIWKVKSCEFLWWTEQDFGEEKLQLSNKQKMFLLTRNKPSRYEYCFYIQINQVNFQQSI